LMIITGPNMGGKSTLLRQACLVVVMAQIGSFVPAQLCELTPTDQIFTRLGASDRIFTGQSTFMMELNETANILKHATPNSFVILDELGRGTSTFDGYAIAFASIKKLGAIGCRCLFSTHYHKLTDEFQISSGVGLGHMACTTENGQMVFMYKLEEGACPKSYGMNVAQMANMDERILHRAIVISEKFEKLVYDMWGQSSMSSGEKEAAQREVFKELMTNLDLTRDDVVQLWNFLKTL